MKKIVILTTVFFFFVRTIYAQPGQLDTTFGSHGIVTTNLGVTYNYNYTSNGKQVLLLPDGSMYILFESSGKTYLSKRLANGSSDISYGNNGFSNSIDVLPSQAALQADGKVVVAGEAFNGTDYDFAVARYNVDGSLDNSFSGDGKQTTDFASDFDNAKAIAIQADGKIILAGETVSSGVYDFGIARYNADGSLDETFSDDGKQTTDFTSDYDNATSVAIQNDGKIIVGGYSWNGLNHDFAIARYGVDGTLDNTFDGDGKLVVDFYYEDFINSIAIREDGKIIAGGYFYTCTDAACDNAQFAVARFNADGTFDNTFSDDGKQATSFEGFAVANSVFTENGKIVMGGYTWNGSNYDFAVASYNNDGSPDNSFSEDGKQITDLGAGSDDNATSVVVQSDGRILAAGSGNSGTDFALVRYNIDGSPDNSLDNDGMLIEQLQFNQGSTYYTSAAVQSNGKIVVAGYTWNGNDYDFGIARYNVNGALDSSFGNNGKQNTDLGSGSDDNATSVAIQPDGKIVLAGETYNKETGYGNFALARYNSNGSADSTFGTNGKQVTAFDGNAYANAVAIQKDGKILAVGSADFMFALARYNTDGSLDKSFSDDGIQTTNFYPLNTYSLEGASSVAIQKDGKIVLGGTASFSSPSIDASYFAYARYNADGNVDTFTTYNFGSDFANAKSLAIQGDGKILLLGSYYKRIDDHTVANPAFAITRLNADGSTDTTFNTMGRIITNFDGDALGTSMAIENNGKIIVAGSVVKPDISNTDFAIARYNKDGTLDSTFDADGKQITDAGPGSESISGIAIANNKIYAVGSGQYPGNVGVIASYVLDEDQTLACPGSKIFFVDSAKCEAVINNIDPVLSGETTQVNYTMTGATTGNGQGSASGKTFNKGVTTVTYSLTGDTTKNCSFSVTVNDSEAPRLSPVFAFPNIIWPATHKMRDVYLFYHSSDNCAVPDCKISVTSNQNIKNDWKIVNDHLVRLRAEHSGGKTRTYTITITCTDDAQNVSIKSVTVKVPAFGRNNTYEDNDVSRPFDGTESKIEKFSVKAFPNPAQNYFNLQVSGNSHEKISLRIYDVNKRLVESRFDLSPGENIITGASLHQGIYIAEVQQGIHVQRLKLIKLGKR